MIVGLHRHFLRLCAFALLATLAACGTTGTHTLKIDESIQATGQDSRVRMIVLHYTAAGTSAALQILSERNVSSHYLITDEPRPTVYQLVDENRRAWHAGVSQWYDNSDINSLSVGVEIVNPGGSGTQWAPYTEAQIDTAIELVRDIAARHQVRPQNIVGHSDIAPQRKLDPGPLFPWKALADAGLGRWYDETLVAQYMGEFMVEGVPDVLWMQNRLKDLGYAVPLTGELDRPTRNVVAAFQMHYRPTLYDGYPDAQTLAILKALPN